MKYSELAEKYNTTIANIKNQLAEFVENEGYLPNGKECETFLDWCDSVFRVKATAEPFQKGDMDYGL